MQNNNPKILLLGPLPPPYMGPTIATEVILNSKLKDYFNLIHLDTSDHRELTTLGAIDFCNIYLALKHYIILFWLIIIKWPAMIYIPISQTTKGYLRDSVFILISKIFRRKVVCHLRGGNFKNWYNSASSLTQWFVRKVHSLVDGQIVLGESLKNLFLELVPERKIYVVPNGRDFNETFLKYPSVNKVRILFFATFDRTKGIFEVLRSVPIVLKSCPNVEFIIAGNWHREKDVNDIKNFLKSNSSLPITIIAPVIGKEKYEILNNSDIFVFPSYSEGHPWVIIEAMAASLPIIATNQGAIKESVIDGINGFIIEKNDPENIAVKIIYLINNSHLRDRMGRESRRLYEENFTEEKMVNNLKLCFDSVLRR